MSKIRDALKNNRLLMLIFGPPGSGKGSFGRQLASDYGLCHLVTGDLLRREVTKQSSVGHRVGDDISRGLYVDDVLVCDIVRNNIKSRSGGFVLDGCPRTQMQASFVKSLATSQNFSLLGVQLDMDRSVLIERLLGRRVCSVCNRTYNVCQIDHGEYRMNALLPSKDDIEKCKGCLDLKPRDDDNMDVITQRLKVYDSTHQEVVASLKGVSFMHFAIRRGMDDYHLFKDQLDLFLGKQLTGGV
ncbi:hypothetical protein BgAZ_204690 [Babesia gibsoni]|uniref:Adenylate kinase n=1 Tax=Babesia gibsoni TaxID=33632 RepID=A0AAD8LL78_BABGI|nr:hypothetical protein BgAZ_204690 [Babesia gibsoni]